MVEDCLLSMESEAPPPTLSFHQNMQTLAEGLRSEIWDWATYVGFCHGASVKRLHPRIVE